MSALPRISPFAWFWVVTVVVSALFLGSSVFATHLAEGIDASAESITTDADPSIRYLSRARTELRAAAALVDGALLNPLRRSSVRTDLDQVSAALRSDLDAYLALPFFPNERAHWAEVDQATRDAQLQMVGVVGRLEAGDVNGATALRNGPTTEWVRRADASLAQLIDFDLHQATSLGQRILEERSHARHWLFALNGASVVLTFALFGVAGGATRRHARLLDQQRRAEAHAREAEHAFGERLERVAQGGARIAEAVHRTIEPLAVLQTATSEARALAPADFAAFGTVRDPARGFDSWVTSGGSSAATDEMGAEPPPPVGLLEVVVREGHSVRVPDVSHDPRPVGLPDPHPPVGPFLGVIARHEGQISGCLYLTRGPGSEPFTEQDERAVELLASSAAVSAQNATLTRSLSHEVAAREDLMAIVSHDLRNPLSAIVMAERRMMAVLPEDHTVRRYTDIVHRSAGRMERLIADLLTVARLQEGKLPIEPTAQQVGPLLADAVESIAPTATEKHLRVSVRVSDDLPVVFVDRDRIQQVLSNLLGNAAKFTPEGGEIVVSASTRDHSVCVSVRDTGPGIAPEAVPHVFDRFWQEGRQARRGTGLGLFIAKGIVEAHGGDISVESHPGAGSDFRVTLPASGDPA